MSHSCFAASAFAAIADRLPAFFLTLHRLEFPANVRVDFQPISLRIVLDLSPPAGRGLSHCRNFRGDEFVKVFFRSL